MNFEEFHDKLAISLLIIMGKGLRMKDVDVQITKSNGETLFCLLNGEEIIDYFKW